MIPAHAIRTIGFPAISTADGEVSAFIAGRIKSVNYMEGCL